MTARAAWFVVAVQLAATVAHADPVEPDEPDENRAAEHLDRGIAAYRARELRRAIDELLEANRLAPDRPDPYRWLALTQAEIDDCQSALINIDTFLSRVPGGDQRVPELLALRDRCLYTGNLDVESSPSGAAIRIDGGAPVGTTPARRLAVRVGPHTITVEKPGFASQSQRVEMRAFGTDRTSFVLTAAHHTPLAQRWWFWAAIGAVAITAIGLTYDTTQSSDPGLPPVTCNTTGCHP